MRDKLYLFLNNFSFFFRRKYKNRLRVLAYHTVPDTLAFEKQLVYLMATYSIISIDDLINYFEGKRKLPKNPLLITFDDGDVSVLNKGLPLLKKYGLPSCLFIITGLINTSKSVWIKRVENEEMSQGKTYQEARQTVNYFKSIPNKERLNKMHSYPEVNSAQLAENQIIKMQKENMFIGNHTHTHPMLNNCTKNEILEELGESKKTFLSLDLPGYSIFAYPNGNNSSDTLKILKEAGIKLIFLFDHKINPRQLDPYHISRIRVDTNTKMTEFKTKVSGVHPFLFNLKSN